jgi:hypothetical protein
VSQVGGRLSFGPKAVKVEFARQLAGQDQFDRDNTSKVWASWNQA